MQHSANQMNTLSCDLSGELISGVFFELRVPFFSIGDDLKTPEEKSPNVIASNSPEGEKYVWAEVMSDRKPIYNCPKDQTHETGEIDTNYRADLYGGRLVSDFVYDHNYNGARPIVSGAFAERLRTSGLSGFESTPVPINVNQSDAANVDLRRLAWGGDTKITRSRKISMQDGNICPFCGWGPIVCDGCGNTAYYCRKCKERVIVLQNEHRGADDPHWRLDNPPPTDPPLEGPILEGKRWNGRDYCDGYVTGRAVRWFQSVHAHPFLCVPCTVNVAGLDGAQRKQMQQAAIEWKVVQKLAN
jgi:hypothetical protein